MVVPVAFGKSSFDYAPLRSEQSRLSKLLVQPSPRDKDDTSKTFEVEDNQSPPSKYPTFIKMTYGAEGSLPRYELYMRDNFDVEFQISGGAVGGTASINGGTATVPTDFTVSPITGNINSGSVFNPTYDGGATQTGTSYTTLGINVGTVKFDGVTGLALASINNRIADVSNAVEGVTKVLSVVVGNIDNVLNTIR